MLGKSKVLRHSTTFQEYVLNVYKWENEQSQVKEFKVDRGVHGLQYDLSDCTACSSAVRE